MADHATDLLTLMIWAFSTVGGGLIAVIVWGGLKILSRLEAIESLLATETKELRADDAHIDKRLTVIEERCHMVHGGSGFAPLARTTGTGWDGEERRSPQWRPNGGGQ